MHICDVGGEVLWVTIWADRGLVDRVVYLWGAVHLSARQTVQIIKQVCQGWVGGGWWAGGGGNRSMLHV